MDMLEKKIEVMELYDMYQNLLTQTQKNYIEAYYYEDMSITEISDEFNVSRNAVHDQIKRTVKKIYSLEEKINLRNKSIIRGKLIDQIKDLNKDDEISKLINELEKVE